MLIYGCLLAVPCGLWFSAVLRMGRWGDGAFDWTIQRWPALIGLMGLACVLAYFSLRRGP
ncbi:MAG TPA: hypothetical protein VMS17_03015 [Gemmataceae bacterium]|nr:hypothetical protein [Gemmataceae bacterium]